MALGNLLSNTPQSVQQLSRLTPTQQTLQGLAGTRATELLNQPQQQFSFEPYANLAMKNFQQRTIPSIAERFASMRGNGTQGGSATIPAFANAGADLQERLAVLGQQFGQQQQGQQQNYLLNLLSQALQPNQENVINPEQAGFGTIAAQAAPQLAGKFIDYLGSAANRGTQGASVGGPYGAGLGAIIGLLEQVYKSRQGKPQQSQLSQFGANPYQQETFFPLQGGGY
jgi:hypothetical protein